MTQKDGSSVLTVVPDMNSDVIKHFASLVASELKQQSRPTRAGITLGQLLDRFIETHAKQRCVKSSVDAFKGTFKNHMSQWADIDLYELKRGDVVKWHAELKTRFSGTTANRAHQLLRSMYNRAISWEIIEDYNPARNITKFKEVKRERFLREDELNPFFEALNSLRYEVSRDYILMCLLTLARKTNVRLMRWEEIDFDRRVWTIPMTKNGESQQVPLEEEEIAILKRRKATSRCQWVFESSFHPGRPIKQPDKAWNKVRRQARIEDVRMHDLRRTGSSWMAMSGGNISAIGAALGHRDLQSTAIYARLDLQPVRDAKRTAIKAMFDAAGIPISTDEATPRTSNLGGAFAIAAEPERWVTEIEAARTAGVSVTTLQQMRFKRTGPPYLKQGVNVRYEINMLRAWATGKHNDDGTESCTTTNA